MYNWILSMIVVVGIVLVGVIAIPFLLLVLASVASIVLVGAVYFLVRDYREHKRTNQQD